MSPPETRCTTVERVDGVTIVKVGDGKVNAIAPELEREVGAATGHAIAAGAFLLLACDVRIGLDGPFKIGFHEVRSLAALFPVTSPASAPCPTTRGDAARSVSPAR